MSETINSITYAITSRYRERDPLRRSSALADLQGGGIRNRRATGLCRNHGPARLGIPPHRHSHEDEALYVLAGRVVIEGDECGERWHLVADGRLLLRPARPDARFPL